MVQHEYFSYSTVVGYFRQDVAATLAQDFDYTNTNFGLLERAYPSDSLSPSQEEQTQWERFAAEVKRLNESTSEGITYKVLYMGRHGQGDHNVAEKRYGTAEWDRYYASLNGDSIARWVDAHLTNLGVQQALDVNAFWKRQITEARTLPPEKYYVSPLYRCLQTANHTFEGLDLPDDRPYKPIVKELLREALGVHTCDRRSSLSFLRSAFPNFTFESNMTVEDELWKADQRETNESLDHRMKTLLDQIFSSDDSTFISLTSHSGAICSLLRVLGHREFRLQTGGLIPVLVKAEKQTRV